MVSLGERVAWVAHRCFSRAVARPSDGALLYRFSCSARRKPATW